MFTSLGGMFQGRRFLTNGRAYITQVVIYQNARESNRTISKFKWVVTSDQREIILVVKTGYVQKFETAYAVIIGNVCIAISKSAVKTSQMRRRGSRLTSEQKEELVSMWGTVSV